MNRPATPKAFEYEMCREHLLNEVAELSDIVSIMQLKAQRGMDFAVTQDCERLAYIITGIKTKADALANQRRDGAA